MESIALTTGNEVHAFNIRPTHSQFMLLKHAATTAASEAGSRPSIAAYVLKAAVDAARKTTGNEPV
jgi:uncharacterized protein (DUF1778 family)